MTPLKHCVYALFASDDPKTVCYVGRTSGSLKTRLAAHSRETKAHPIKAAWFASVTDRGATVQIRALEYCGNPLALAFAEWCWLRFYRTHGELTNRVFDFTPRNLPLHSLADTRHCFAYCAG